LLSVHVEDNIVFKAEKNEYKFLWSCWWDLPVRFDYRDKEYVSASGAEMPTRCGQD
jgi:hypothetical protein